MFDKGCFCLSSHIGLCGKLASDISKGNLQTTVTDNLPARSDLLKKLKIKENLVLFVSSRLFTKKVSTQTMVCSMWFWTTNVTITEMVISFEFVLSLSGPRCREGLSASSQRGGRVSLWLHIWRWSSSKVELLSCWRENTRRPICVADKWASPCDSQLRPHGWDTTRHLSATRWVPLVGTQLRGRMWWLYSFSCPFYLCPYSSVRVALCSPSFCATTVRTLRMLSPYDILDLGHTQVHTLTQIACRSGSMIYPHF